MKIIIDSRETKPLSFRSLKTCKIETEVRKLDVGDYALELANGDLAPIIFERKSKGDLWGTLGKGYARFKRELELANKMGVELLLIIEVPYDDVRAGYTYINKRGKCCYSKKSGSATVSQIHTLNIKHGLIPIFCTSRDEMSRYIRDYFIAYERNYVKWRAK